MWRFAGDGGNYVCKLLSYAIPGKCLALDQSGQKQKGFTQLNDSAVFLLYLIYYIFKNACTPVAGASATGVEVYIKKRRNLCPCWPLEEF